jgi:hypothetical protein
MIDDVPARNGMNELAGSDAGCWRDESGHWRFQAMLCLDNFSSRAPSSDDTTLHILG